MHIILVIILILIVINILGRIFFKYLFYRIRKKYKNFQSDNYSNSKNGDIHVKHKPYEKKIFSQNAGEYVDFEDIK